MEAFRALIRQHKPLAIFLLACALITKVVIPSGFMPVATGHGIAIEVCSGMGPVIAATPARAMPGMPNHQEGHKDGKSDSPCVYAGLSAPSLAAADAVLLALAIVFVLAMGLQAALPIAPPSVSFLRPPLRGPPAA
jgi:hypothetical protein